MIIDTEQCTEEQALDAYDALTRRFGWTGAFLCRADVEETMEMYVNLDRQVEEERIEVTLNDAQWHQLSTSPRWRSITEYVVECAWESAHDIIRDYGYDEEIMS